MFSFIEFETNVPGIVENKLKTAHLNKEYADADGIPIIRKSKDQQTFCLTILETI